MASRLKVSYIELGISENLKQQNEWSSAEKQMSQHITYHTKATRAVCKQCSRWGFEVGTYQQCYHLWQVA